MCVRNQKTCRRSLDQAINAISLLHIFSQIGVSVAGCDRRQKGFTTNDGQPMSVDNIDFLTGDFNVLSDLPIGMGRHLFIMAGGTTSQDVECSGPPAMPSPYDEAHVR